MALTKPAGEWQYEDLERLPDDGKRYEIIEGELYEMPPPSAYHAVTLINLLFLLGPAVLSSGGRIFTAPFDVFFPGVNPVQPDIVVTLTDLGGRLRRRGFEGAVIEDARGEETERGGQAWFVGEETVGGVRP